MKKEVNDILAGIIHPETGVSIVEAGMVESLAMSDDRIAVTLAFSKARDPFMNSIRKQVKERLEEAFPHMSGKVNIVVKEAAPAPKTTTDQAPKTAEGTSNVKKIVAVASGKGGVGKSTVTSNLAVTLTSMGYKVGVLDADIYGPSQPKMFGIEGELPTAELKDGQEMIIPIISNGVKVMSIGFFIRPEDALAWRGPMATGALKQLIHQTDWGELDFLLLDLPPGTGDVHLTILSELKIDGAVIVSTPQQIAIADVLRGVNMFRSPQINVPVLGIIENMAWFTPEELPDNRYYIFGQGGAARFAEEQGVPLIGEIPIIMSVMEGAETGQPGSLTSHVVSEHYEAVARNIIKNL